MSQEYPGSDKLTVIVQKIPWRPGHNSVLPPLGNLCEESLRSLLGDLTWGTSGRGMPVEVMSSMAALDATVPRASRYACKLAP